MPYDPALVQPMRDELTAIGVDELMTADAVDSLMESARSGTALVIINSVCGCAAGKARPGIRLALQHENRPEHVGTVFAGQDIDATAKARSYFADFPPSSPSLALFKNGEVVHFVPRHRIEDRPAEAIAFDLVEAFDEHCSSPSGS